MLITLCASFLFSSMQDESTDKTIYLISPHTTSHPPKRSSGRPVMSLCILIFTFPIATYHIISLKFSIANSRNSSSSISSMSICFCILYKASQSILSLLNFPIHSTNFSMQLNEIWWRQGLTIGFCPLCMISCNQKIFTFNNCQSLSY